LFHTILFNFELICSLQVSYLFAIVVNAQNPLTLAKARVYKYRKLQMRYL